MASRGNGKWVGLLLLLAAAAAGFYYFRDTAAPAIRLTPGDGVVINQQAKLALQVEDAGSGLRFVQVRLRSGDQERLLLDRQFDAVEPQLQLEIEPAAMKPAQGPLEVIVTTGDRSLYHFGSGNRTEQSFTFRYDSRPPAVSVLSQQHNINHGGAGLIVYTLNEAVRRTGVTVGERYYPGYLLNGDTWACLFPFPHDANPERDTVRLLAEDEAGNTGYGKFYYRVRKGAFPSDRITLTDGFMENIRQEFSATFPDNGDLLELFLKVNRTLREENRARLPEIAARTAPKPLWQGGFSRQPGRRTGAFADHRTYLYQGREVDRQVHLGIDIASTAAAPVYAAAGGAVVWADPLGIYGLCVIIDHGLGLQTLYGHLSKIDVTVGQTLQEGEPLGRSGATGIAGGDHLHFGVVLHGVESNPTEWWDPQWVKEHIQQKLALRP